MGNQSSTAKSLAALGDIELGRQDYTSEQGYYEQCLQIVRNTGDRRCEGGALGQRAAHSSLNIDNTEEPFRVELICYLVLHALGDPHAPAILESAYQRLQDRATKIPNVTLQRSFLENVPHHREIGAAWQSHSNA